MSRNQVAFATSTGDPLDWRHRAACLVEDPELFFPIGTTGPAVLQIQRAKLVCGRCEVVAECRQFAFGTKQDAGVWGGLSEDERRKISRAESRSRLAAERARSDGTQ